MDLIAERVRLAVPKEMPSRTLVDSPLGQFVRWWCWCKGTRVSNLHNALKLSNSTCFRGLAESQPNFEFVAALAMAMGPDFGSKLGVDDLINLAAGRDWHELADRLRKAWMRKNKGQT